MSEEKTLEQCKLEVAKKYKLGRTLVAGHLSKYWEESASLYADQFRSAREINKNMVSLPETIQDETFIEHEISYQHHGVVRMAIFRYKQWLRERMDSKI